MQDFALNKDVPVPLYYQFKQILLEKIMSGALAESECLPTEMTFVSRLGISRSTVRQAFHDLVNEGWLTREKGKGTFVRKPKIDEGFFQKLDSFNQEMRQKGMEPGTQVLDLRQADGRGDINGHLSLPEEASLLYLCRLRKADNVPVVYLETWLPFEPVQSLLSVDFTSSSLYAVLEEQYGLRVERVVRKIEAVGASGKEAKLLGLKSGAPVCLVRTTAYLGDGTPIEYSIARYRGDRNQFTVELVRK
jgi:GntR family transcriptional regulator